MRKCRFILTGAPGAGKTAILRQLEVDGFSAVEEAATDVIALDQAKDVAEPWTDPSFIDRIVALQRHRRLAASGETQFHDRSAFAPRPWGRSSVIHPPTCWPGRSGN